MAEIDNNVKKYKFNLTYTIMLLKETYTCIKYFLIYNTITCINGQEENQIFEYFNDIQENLIKDEKAHIEKQQHNEYIAIYFRSTCEESMREVFDICLVLLETYRKMNLDFDENWILSTLKQKCVSTNLENLYILTKYIISKQFADVHEGKINYDKSWDYCETQKYENLDAFKQLLNASNDIPFKLKVIGNCFEHQLDYSVMLRDVKYALAEGLDIDILLICLKFTNDEQKNQWDLKLKDMGASTFEYNRGGIRINVVNKMIGTDIFNLEGEEYPVTGFLLNSKSRYDSYHEDYRYKNKWLKKTKNMSIRQSLFTTMYLYDEWDNDEFTSDCSVLKLFQIDDYSIRWKVIFENFYDKIIIYLSSQINLVDLGTKECERGIEYTTLFFGYRYKNSNIVVHHQSYPTKHYNLNKRNLELIDILPKAYLTVNYNEALDKYVMSFDKLLNFNFFDLETRNIINESFRGSFIKDCEFDNIENVKINYTNNHANINELVIDICEAFKPKYKEDLNIFLYKYAVKSADIYKFYSSTYKVRLIEDLFQEEMLFEVRDYEHMKNYSFEEDYFLHLCFTKRYVLYHFILILPSLAINVKDFNDFISLKKNIKTDVLNAVVKKNSTEFEISETLISVLNCSINTLTDFDLFHSSTNRNTERVFLNYILDFFDVNKSSNDNGSINLSEIMLIKEQLKLSKRVLRVFYCILIIDICKEISFDPGFLNNIELIKIIINNFFDAIREQFKTYADKQKNKHIIYIIGLNYSSDLHIDFVSTIEKKFCEKI